MLRAKDIMNKDLVTVRKDSEIYKCLELMVKHRITGIPVVEDDMTLTGIISEKDVLHFFHKQEDLKGKKVNDFMTQPAIFFDENESMLDVCNLLAKQIFRRIPITSKGKLVGIISRGDIIEHIVKAKKPVDNIQDQHLSVHR